MASFSTTTGKRKDAVGRSVEAQYSSTSKITDFIEDAAAMAPEKGQLEKRTKFIKDKIDQMDEDQLTRFEFFIRSHLSRHKIKDIIAAKMGSKNPKEISDEMAIVVGSLAKLFCGELVGTATEVLQESNSTQDGLSTKHIREAMRRLQREGVVNSSAQKLYTFGSSTMISSTTIDDVELISDYEDGDNGENDNDGNDDADNT